jgi:cell division GTPase FtsZ
VEAEELLLCSGRGQREGSTRYAWIGAGQCGGRLVQSFYDLGYRKVLAVDTTGHDLALLDLPQSQKFLIGAGRDKHDATNA